MIPRIKSVEPLQDFILRISFDDNKNVLYDVKEDIRDIPSYRPLETVPGLFGQVLVDESRTVIYWNDRIDLPSDTLYEYGVPVLT